MNSSWCVCDEWKFTIRFWHKLVESYKNYVKNFAQMSVVFRHFSPTINCCQFNKQNNGKCNIELVRKALDKSTDLDHIDEYTKNEKSIWQFILLIICSSCYEHQKRDWWMLFKYISFRRSVCWSSTYRRCLKLDSCFFSSPNFLSIYCNSDLQMCVA